jgi:hypothetical protein
MTEVYLEEFRDKKKTEGFCTLSLSLCQNGAKVMFAQSGRFSRQAAVNLLAPPLPLTKSFGRSVPFV